MTDIQPYVDQDELFLDRHLELEWVDDVDGYRCTRCHKVLVQHYIANCEHKFCGNCKRVVDDGSHRWKCPNCRHFIKDMDAQSPSFKDKVIGLRVHCLNRNYGCPHICPFKYLKEHLAGCEHTKERALPVLIPGGPTVKMLDRMFSAQLLHLRNEMNRKLDEMEKRMAERDARAWELSVGADEMQRGMLRMEERQKDGEENVEAHATNFNCKVNGIRSDLNMETSSLKNDILTLRNKITNGDLESFSSAVEENKLRIMKLEAKSENFLEITECSNRKNVEQMQRLKNDVERELKIAKVRTQSEMSRLEQTINENTLEREKKWAESKDRVIDKIKKERKEREKVTSSVFSQILALNGKVEDLGKDLHIDLQNQMSKLNERLEMMSLTLIAMQKSMGEMNEKELAREKKWTELNDKWALNESGQVKSDEQKASTSAIYEEKVNKAEKLQSKHTLSPELQVYNSFIKPEHLHLRRVSEYYTEKPDFTWIVSGVTSLTSGSDIPREFAGSAKELLSEVFPLRKYPFSAQMKMTLYDDDRNKIWYSLSFSDRKETNKPIEIRPLFNIYLTLKDQSSNKKAKNIIKLCCNHNSLEEKFKYNDFYLVGSINKTILESDTYNVEDKVFININVEPPEVARMVYSLDGTLTWAIDDCQKKIEMEANGLIESNLSPYFYTSLNGYRMQLKIRLNGYGKFKNKGVSVRVVFLSGLYDEHLEKKFRYKTTINIFHPQQPHRNISKSEERDYDKIWHRHSFDMGSHAEIENFLHNDTLYYEATIKVIKPPTK